MTISANTLGLLMAAGIEGDELMDIVRSIEADTAPKAKSSAAARQARYRESQKAKTVTSNVTRDVTETSQVTPLAGGDAKPNKTQIEPVKKTPSRDVADFKAELSALDADRLEALIKHRKSKKAQMTGHAARLFKREVEACGLSLAEAADICIDRNWITVKADWLAKPAARGSPSPPQKQFAQNFGDFTNFVETRNAPEPRDDFEGPQRSIQHLSIVSTG